MPTPVDAAAEPLILLLLRLTITYRSQQALRSIASHGACPRELSPFGPRHLPRQRDPK